MHFLSCALRSVPGKSTNWEKLIAVRTVTRKLGTPTAIVQKITNILESTEFYSLAENVDIIKSRDQLVLFFVTTRNVKIKGRWNNSIMQAIHLQKLGKKQMIKGKPWSNPPDDCMRTKLQHVHHYEWKHWVVLLEFHRKSDLSHSPISIDTYYTLCSAKDLANLALVERTVGLGHISMLWRSILLVHFQRLPQWGSSMGVCTWSLGNTFSLVRITCIPQDSQYLEMPFLLLSSFIWKMLLYCLLAVPSSLTLAVSSLSHAPPWDLYLYLSAHTVSLQQSTVSSLLFFAGSSSLMRSCYETLLQGKCSW